MYLENKFLLSIYFLFLMKQIVWYFVTPWSQDLWLYNLAHDLTYDPPNLVFLEANKLYLYYYLTCYHWLVTLRASRQYHWLATFVARDCHYYYHWRYLSQKSFTSTDQAKVVVTPWLQDLWLCDSTRDLACDLIYNPPILPRSKQTLSYYYQTRHHRLITLVARRASILLS